MTLIFLKEAFVFLHIQLLPLRQFGEIVFGDSKHLIEVWVWQIFLMGESKHKY